MKLLAALRHRAGQTPQAGVRRRRPAPDWVDATLAPAPPPEDDAATAAPQSWFESSWVLRSGVSVTELAAPEPLAFTPSSPPCR